jgi:SAM-dependent methyltransferase
MPHQLTGVDVRAGAIELAKKLNPAITFLRYDGERLPFPDKSKNWVSLFAVVSSIQSAQDREHLASEVRRVLVADGYLLFVDLTRYLEMPEAVPTGAPLNPEEMFSEFRTVSAGRLPPFGDIRQLIRRPGRFLAPLLKPITYRPRYLSYLYQRRDVEPG